MVPIFHESLEMVMQQSSTKEKISCMREEYSISAKMGDKISKMPDLIEWIVFSILTGDRHLIITPYWEI
jgi:hypothetical protein